MLTMALAALGVCATMLAPVLVYLASRRRHHRAVLADLHDRIETRDATIAALWDYVLQLRYWMVKADPDDQPPTMPSTLTVAAVRARVDA